MGQCALISSCLEVGLQLALSRCTMTGDLFTTQSHSFFWHHSIQNSILFTGMRTSGTIISHHAWSKVIMSIRIRVILSLIQLSWYSDLWCRGAAASEVERVGLGRANSGTPPSWEERTRLDVPDPGPWYGLSRSKETTQAGRFWCNCCVWEYRNGGCKH